MTPPVSPRLVCTPAVSRQVGQVGQLVRNVYTSSARETTEIFANATAKNGETVTRNITSRVKQESNNVHEIRLPDAKKPSDASPLPKGIQKKETEDHYTENRYGSGGIVGC